MVGRLRGKPKFANSQDYELDQGADSESSNKLLLNKGHVENSSYNNNSSKNSLGLDSLIEEYNEYHSKWVERVKQIASASSSTANNGGSHSTES